MSNVITITKGKLLKGDKLEVEYLKKVDGENKPAQVSEKHKASPHPDLKNAFMALNIHAALIGEFVPLVQVSKIEEADESIAARFNTSGFTIIGIDDDDEGVILTAQKILNNGKNLTFNTPTTRFNDTGDNIYPYIDQLQEAVKGVVKELELYLGGKYAPEPQMQLDLEDAAK